MVPPGFVEIDPPVGFVTMDAGPHIPTVGPTDFEAQLIGQSVVGTLVPDWAWIGSHGGPGASIEDELELVATTDAPRVFAHLMAPHPPFFYADGGRAADASCWPTCGLLRSHLRGDGHQPGRLGRAGMRAQVAALNEQLLEHRSIGCWIDTPTRSSSSSATTADVRTATTSSRTASIIPRRPDAGPSRAVRRQPGGRRGHSHPAGRLRIELTDQQVADPESVKPPGVTGTNAQS